MFKIVSKIRHENIIAEIKESHRKELFQKQNILNDERRKIKHIEAKLREEEKKGKLKDDEIRRLYQTIESEESDLDKKINRLKAIAKRTKKYRIRKKCIDRIFEYDLRKTILENERYCNEKRYI
ncbi:MAG: hypothetical protein E7G47_10915 [Clostridium perfringens]|nr:hypothetical protein [Clostridium perfringens]